MKITLNKGAVSYDVKSKGMVGSIWMKFFDKSAILLLFSNVVVIIFAIGGQINASEVFYLYWLQSIIIGVFAFLKIRSLKNFNTKNLYINGAPAKADDKTKNILSIFFVFHYGLFHLVYLVFIIALLKVNVISFLIIIGVASIFFVNHLYSYRYNCEKDRNANKNIGKIMFKPYLRIVPMHIAIIFGVILPGGLILFLILKTLADFLMHNSEHNANTHIIKN